MGFEWLLDGIPGGMPAPAMAAFVPLNVRAIGDTDRDCLTVGGGAETLPPGGGGIAPGTPPRGGFISSMEGIPGGPP